MSISNPTVSTFIDLLAWRAQHQPEQIAYTFLLDGEHEAIHITYAELEQKAQAIASQLQHVTSPGERALLLYPSGLDFIAGFFGCLCAGVIAVPAYPPHRNRADSRLQAITIDAQPAAVLTTASLFADLEECLIQTPTLANAHWFTTDTIASRTADHSTVAWQRPAIGSESLAFLQYTSGSTGSPKGVMVSHGNLLTNQQMIQQAFGHTDKTIVCGWLPLFHDMGLVGNVLQPLYVGIPSVLMSPSAFLQKPVRWLQAIARYGATTSGGPNFGYELCIHKIRLDETAGLDLTCWDLAFNGAEPVRADTLAHFVTKFAPLGFHPAAFYPCYGMAETTLFVAGGIKTEPPQICQIEVNALAHHQVVFASGRPPTSQPIVSCGRSWCDQQIVIADPTTGRPCSPAAVGEIWVAGPHVAHGYWQRPAATADTFHAHLAGSGAGPFLRTGDLGFMHNGELFITGRLKDVMIIRGKNHYPQDIEQSVEACHSALQPGGGAAFAIEVHQEERLVIVQEVARTHLRTLDSDAVMRAIQRAVAEKHQLQVHAIALLRPGQMPKTSSGKIQRHACRAAFLDSALTAVAHWPSPHGLQEGSLERTATTASTMLETQGRQTKGLQTQETQPERIHTEMAQSASFMSAETSKQRADDLIAWLRDYGENYINSRLIDERRTIPPYIVLDFGNRGLLGVCVPLAYGGAGFNNRDTVRIAEQMGAIDQTLSTFVANHNILGSRPIQNFAAESVKADLLPRLATGRELAGFALTEPGAGSNPRALATQAMNNGDRGWLLRGAKSWTGSAAWSGFLNVFARHPETGQLSGFIVQRGAQGLRMGPEALTMGMRGMVQNRIDLYDVPVAPSHLLGEVGGGIDVAQDAMMYARLILAAGSVGGMKRCAQLMLRYTTRRTVSTGNLLNNPVTLTKLSELTAAITAVHRLVMQMAYLLDAGWTIPTEIYAVVKITGSEFFWQAADTLMQSLGGRGYIEANIAPQLLRDARILRIFEGPTETLTMFLGSCLVNGSEEFLQFLSQGFNAPHIAARLRLATAEIRERHLPANQTTAHSAANKQWLYALVGEVAIYATLSAALEGIPLTTADTPQAVATHAPAWAQHHFARKIADALACPLDAARFRGRADITELVMGYTTTIGDIEQSLADEDRELDVLLRRDPVQPTHGDVSSYAPASAASKAVSAQTGVMSPTVLADGSKATTKFATAANASQGQVSNRQSVESIARWMVDWLSRALNVPAQSIETAKPFAELGVDSLKTVEFAHDVTVWLQLSQPPDATVAWNFPTIDTLAQHLAEMMAAEAAHPSEHRQPTTDEPAPRSSAPQGRDRISPAPPEQPDANIDELSEAALVQLLATELASARERRTI